MKNYAKTMASTKLGLKGHVGYQKAWTSALKFKMETSGKTLELRQI